MYRSDEGHSRGVRKVLHALALPMLAVGLLVLPVARAGDGDGVVRKYAVLVEDDLTYGIFPDGTSRINALEAALSWRLGFDTIITFEHAKGERNWYTVNATIDAIAEDMDSDDLLVFWYNGHSDYSAPGVPAIYYLGGMPTGQDLWGSILDCLGDHQVVVLLETCLGGLFAEQADEYRPASTHAIYLSASYDVDGWYEGAYDGYYTAGLVEALERSLVSLGALHSHASAYIPPWFNQEPHCLDAGLGFAFARWFTIELHHAGQAIATGASVLGSSTYTVDVVTSGGDADVPDWLRDACYAEFLLDGQICWQDATPPFSHDLDTTDVPEGDHDLQVGLYRGSELVASRTVRVQVVRPDAPALSSATVTGDGDTRTFTVVYTDADNDPPDYVRVVIDGGTPRALVPFVPGDTDYTNGAVFTGTWAGFTSGDHTCYFEAASNGDVCRDPPLASDVIEFTVVPPAPNALTISASGPVAVDGTSVSMIHVTLRLPNGSPAPGQAIAFANVLHVNGGFCDASGAIGTAWETRTTDATGQCTTYFRPTATGTVVIGAQTAGGLAAEDQFEAVPASNNILTLNVRLLSGGDTGSTYEVKGTVTDAAGNPKDPGTPVTFETTRGLLNNSAESQTWSTPFNWVVEDGWTGLSTAHLRTTTSGSATVTFRYGAQSLTVTVYLQVGGTPAYGVALTVSSPNTYALDIGGHRLVALCNSSYPVVLRVFSTDTWEQAAQYQGLHDPDSADMVDVDPTGVKAFATGEAAFFDLTTGAVVENSSLQPQDDLSIHPNLQYGASWQDNVVTIYRASDANVYRTLGTFTYMGSIEFSPDGTLLAFGHRHQLTEGRQPTLRCYAASGSWNAQWVFSGELGKLDGGLCWSPDSQFIAWCEYSVNRVRIVNRSGNEVRQISTATRCYHPAWSPDGAKLAIHGEDGVNVYDPSNGQKLYSLQGAPLLASPDEFGTLAWTHDSKKIAVITRGGGTIYVFAPYDTTPPVIALSSPSNGTQTTEAQVTVAGTITDDTKVDAATATWYLNGGTPSPLSLDATGGFQFVAPLSAGVNTITVNANDTLGHTGTASVTVTRLVDTVPPTISGTGTAPSPVEIGAGLSLWARVSDSWSGVNAASVAVQIQYPDGVAVAEVQLFDDGLHGDDGAGDGLFKGSVPTSSLTEALHLLDFTALDLAGNRATVNNALTLAAYDRPVISGVLHAPAPPGSNAPVVVTATIQDSSPIVSAYLEYRRDGVGDWTSILMAATAGDLWSGTIPAVPTGSVEYRVTATDAHLHSTTSSSFTYAVVDVLPPGEFVVWSPSHVPSGWSNDPTVNIGWSAPGEVGSGLAGYGVVWDTATDTVPTAITHAADLRVATSPALPEAIAYHAHVRAVDLAGNWGTTQHLGPFRIDQVPPTSWSVATEAEVSLAGNDTLSGLASIQYRVNGGAWTTYSSALSLGNGDTVDFYGRDHAENDESPFHTYVYESAFSAPTAVITSVSPPTAFPVTDTVQFREDSHDNDEEGDTIVAWIWRSNLGLWDGSQTLSTQANPDLAADDLQVGAHTISLWVQDDEGGTDTATHPSALVVQNGLPVIDAAALLPNNVTKGSRTPVVITGTGHDTDERQGAITEWQMVITGPEGYTAQFTAEGASLNHVFATDGLSPGSYQVVISAQDDEGTRSASVARVFAVQTGSREVILFGAQAVAGGAYEIYEVNPDGSGLVSLTADFSPAAWSPRISPDGRKIAFGSDKQIWYMNADGSGKTQVPLPTEPYGPSLGGWLNDQRFFFYSGPAAGNGLLRAVDLNGANNAVLVNRPLGSDYNIGVDSSRAAASGRLAFVGQTGSYSPSYDVYLANPDGSSPQLFYADAGNNIIDRRPIWSRDGETLYWGHSAASGVVHNLGVVRKALSSSTGLNGYDAIVWAYDGVATTPQALSLDGTELLVSRGNGQLAARPLAGGADRVVQTAASMGEADWGLLGDPNRNPTALALSEKAVDENAAAGTVVGTVSTTDPDAGDTFAYLLVSGTGDTDNRAFVLDGSVLKTVATFDHETQPTASIRLRTTDPGGLWREESFTITVNNVSPEVFTVTTPEDSGPGSLREVIFQANNCGDTTQITFADWLGAITPASPLPAITVAVSMDCGIGNTITQGLSVSGGGSVVVSGAAGAITGDTTVAAGVLTLTDDSLAGSQVAVQSAGVLRGNGSVGALTISSGGHLAPGNSPGAISSGNTVWSGGGNYDWEINDAKGMAGTDPGWDLLHVNGTLNIAATPSSRFVINLLSLQADNTPGPMVNFNPSEDAQWTIVKTTGGILGLASESIDLNTTGIANSLGGGRFSLSVAGMDLVLKFSKPTPTAATLISFRAIAEGRTTVKVQWRTGVEYGTLGFYVQRLTAGGWKQIGGLIPAFGLVSRRAYEITETLPPGSGPICYRLLEVDLRGNSHVAGETTLRPAITTSVKATQGTIQLSLSGPPDQMLIVETSLDSAAGWNRCGTVMLDRSGRANLWFQIETNTPLRLFRIIEE